MNTKSTMEAEFVALDKATEEAEWLRSFLEGIPLWPKPVTAVCIHCDSMAALTRAKNQIYNGKSRHIRHHHNTIKDLLRNGIISINYVKSKENIANPLTKGLYREQVIFASRVEYYEIFLIGITYTRLMCGRIFGNQMAKILVSHQSHMKHTRLPWSSIRITSRSLLDPVRSGLNLLMGCPDRIRRLRVLVVAAIAAASCKSGGGACYGGGVVADWW
ncbi:hypothetical protein Tco_1355919 [Tanacetum coccineum]